MKKIVGMVLAGGRVDELLVLTAKRPKSALAMWGNYRIIDFVLSNMMHAGIEVVGVLSQYRPYSLNTHLLNGEPWDYVGRSRVVRVLSPSRAPPTLTGTRARRTPCIRISPSSNDTHPTWSSWGFRIGWVVASRTLVQIMTNVQAQTTSCTSLVLQAAAEGALTGIQSHVDTLRLTLENNRNVMMQELRSFTGVKTIKPDGTYYCLPDFRAYNGNSVALSQFLLKRALVVTVPGKEFGVEGHLRLSYCGTIKEIMEGLARIKWELDPESPNEIYIGDRKLRRDWK